MVHRDDLAPLIAELENAGSVRDWPTPPSQSNPTAAGAFPAEPESAPEHHVGDVLSQALSISNTGTADGFTETVDASIADTTGSATATGSFAGLAAGVGNGTNLTVGRTALQDGVQSGNASLSLTSDMGSGVDTLVTTALTAQTITATGTLYHFCHRQCRAPEPAVNFGIVHVGDIVNQTLSIGNLATVDGFSE